MSRARTVDRERKPRKSKPLDAPHIVSINANTPARLRAHTRVHVCLSIGRGAQLSGHGANRITPAWVLFSLFFCTSDTAASRAKFIESSACPRADGFSSAFGFPWVTTLFTRRNVRAHTGVIRVCFGREREIFAIISIFRIEEARFDIA